MKLGEKVNLGSSNKEEGSGLASMNLLRNLDKGHVIKGVHQGKFQSKKRARFWFHVFKDVDGSAHGYGACLALDERVKEIHKKQDELGKKLYAEIEYQGELDSKKDPDKTFHSFRMLSLTEVLEGGESDGTDYSGKEEESGEMSVNDIPF